MPSPVGGWNTRDSLDDMDINDAVVLDNWIPEKGKVSLRNGYEVHSDASLSAVDVESLSEYHAANVQKLIGAVDDKVIDYSTATPSTLGSGFTSARWQMVNFNAYLLLVGKGNTPQKYDGSTLSANTFTGTCLTPSNLDGIMVHKNRLYLWDSETQDFWYGAVNAISGTLTKFPLSRIGQFGGNLILASSWNVDAGDGIDDLAVFVMSSGQTIVYQGDDPGDATAWSLVGVYNIGQPINIRGVVEVGGDLIISTYDDYVSLKKILSTGYIGSSSKLSGALQDAAQANGSSDGWQSVLYPNGSLIILNVPNTDGTYYQHVINTITGSPARLTGIKSHCWATFDGGLYFGGDDGIVYKYTGWNDNGSQIEADARQAWSDLGTPYRKRIAATRPVLKALGDVNYEMGIGFDFRDALAPSPSVTESSDSEWDVSPWDTTPWGVGETVSVIWRVGGGTGQTVSPRLRVNAKTSISWLRTDYLAEKGIGL